VSRGAGGFPFVEEGQDVFWGHGTSGFELAAFLAEEEFAIRIEDGDGGDTAFERNIIVFGDFEIFIHLADVDVGDDERPVEGGGDFGGVEGFVEHVTIKAPVAAEDEENTLVGGRGGMDGFGDLFVGIDALGIEVLVFERLTEARGRRMGGDTEVPLVSLAEPILLHGDKLFSGGDAWLHRKGELHDDGMDVGSGLPLLDDLGGEIGEALGLKRGPEGDLVWEGDGLLARPGDFRSGRFGVKGRERGGIPGKNGGAPFFEGREGRGGGELMSSDANSEGKSD